MDAGLVKGEGFAVDASVIEADASRYHGKAPDEIDWSLPDNEIPELADTPRLAGRATSGACDLTVSPVVTVQVQKMVKGGPGLIGAEIGAAGTFRGAQRLEIARESVLLLT
jgi:hypothetical protein